MPGRLQDKVVLVTGSAGGIGSALVHGMLAEGASVMAVDLSEALLAAQMAAMARSGHGGRLLPCETDVSDARACASCIEECVSAFGRIDALVNNAALGMGVVRADHMTNLVGIEELAPEVWDRVIQVNFSGAWYMTRYAVPHMRRAGQGRIIDVSTSFFTMLRGRFHPYGPAKAGMEAMAAGHAAEFAGTGITVNVVVPGGPTDTPMVPADSPYARSALIDPRCMVAPMVWLIGEADDAVNGRRFVAARWDEALAPAQAAERCAAPIAWPELAQQPVWPGERPAD